MTFSKNAILLFLLLHFSIGYPGAQEITDYPPDANLPFFLGAPATAKPIPAKEVTPHPYLAPQSSIHVDMYNSGVIDLQTPLGISPVVQSRSYGDFIGMCLNFFYDTDNNLYAFCGDMPDGLLGMNIEFQLALIDPVDLTKRAKFTLLSFSLLHLLGIPMEFGYMNLDSLGRLIAIDDDNRVLFVGLQNKSENPEFAVLETLDLSDWVDPNVDSVASVVPDYDGNYWFMTLGINDDDGQVTQPAMLGYIDKETEEVFLHEFTGEVIENGLALGPDGIFPTTDCAQYGFRWDVTDRQIVMIWREEYERSTVIKPGVISPRGSGATPTLLDDRYVIITDNADEQINLLVYDRRQAPSGERLVCKVPIFEPGASANENSPVAVGRSILVQNWYNAPNMIFGDHSQMTPGLWRIDISENGSGCDVVWKNEEVAAPGTIKMSTATGLIYSAMQDQSVGGMRAWYAVAVDFETGETVYKVLLGNGFWKDIMYIPVYFAPDGALLQPVLRGVISVRDSEQSDDDDDASLDDDDTDDQSTLFSDSDDDDNESGCGCTI